MFYVVCSTMLYTYVPADFCALVALKSNLLNLRQKRGQSGIDTTVQMDFFVLFPKNSREIPRVSHKNGEDHHNSVWHLHNNALLAGEEGAIQYNKQMIRVLSSPFSFVL